MAEYVCQHRMHEVLRLCIQKKLRRMVNPKLEEGGEGV